MDQFPHAALCPREATPRITPAHAEEVMRLIEENGSYKDRPAIIIAVWVGGLVKYLVDDQQVEETIRNLHEAANAKGTDE